MAGCQPRLLPYPLLRPNAVRSYTPAVTDWLARIDDEGSSLAAFRAKRAAVVAVSAAYVAFWAWLAFAIGFCAILVGSTWLADLGSANTGWEEPAGLTPALRMGALAAVVAGAIAAVHALAVWRLGTERALDAVCATPADPTQDRQLLNIVEELGLASGLPAPAVYVIESGSLNAFSASGRRKPCIAVTTGLCESLSRAELAAVVGHELTHLRNHDGVLLIFVGVLVGPIAEESRVLTRSGRAVIMFIPALICWGLATLLGRFATTGQAGLTDLDSLELTRDPGALADALDKMRHDRSRLEEGGATVAQLLTVPPAESDGDVRQRIAALREMTA
jgi:Zn-dependent protease with chaperone function